MINDKVCPLTANNNGTRPDCRRSRCALWSENFNNCLIALALNKYVRSEIENDKKVENLQTQMKAVSLGFAPFFPGEEKDWSGLQGGL